MRLFKAVVLLNLAFALGLLSGYLWWERDVERLRRELVVARQTPTTDARRPQSWIVTGVVRAARQGKGAVTITNEPIPGLMGAMTMTFRVSDPAATRGLAPGDRIQFTLVTVESDLRIAALRKLPPP